MRISDWSSDVCSSDLSLCIRGHRECGTYYGAKQDTDMILFIGFIAAGPREAIQASPKWIDGLSAYEGDPVIRASDASTVAKYGTRVTEMLAGGHQKARSPLQIYHRSEEHTSELQSLMRH